MRNRIMGAGLGLLGWAGAALATAGEIDPALRVAMDNAGESGPVSALVYLNEQVDLDVLESEFARIGANRAMRHELTVLSLQAMAQTTQGDLLDYLAGRKDAGAVADYHAYWIVNAIRVDALPSELEAIAARQDVGTVHLNYQIELIKPVNYEALPLPSTEPAGQGGGPDAPEIGVVAVRAPEVWAMGYTGAGVLVSTLDTGIQKDHPALTSRYRGTNDPRYAGHPEWAYYNPEQSEFTGSHGTHTMGTVCGGPPGDEIGVAPGAQFIHAATIDRAGIQRTVDDSILAFQWLIDPDGNPATVWDVPDVCANGWGLTTGNGYGPCDETFWQFLDSCESAGIVILFGAGGESTAGLRRPADRATDDFRTLAVGAVDASIPSWPLASFSSRGPSNCTPNGSPAIKPEMAGPGVNVRSASPVNSYSAMSGTSMSTAHLAGVVALMRQANPGLDVQQVKQILYDTAFDLGSPGNDNLYGHGMIDAVEAVTLAIGLATLRFEFPNGRPLYIHPAGGTSFRVEIVALNATPAPGTGRLHYDAGGGFVDLAMTEVAPNVYDAVFPAMPCGVRVHYYVSVEDTTGQRHTSPFDAPNQTFEANTISYIDVWVDDFEADRGWTVDNQNLQTGAWERDVPIPPTRVQEPPRDFDGSGQCYVTGNTPGQDVDGGPTYLISPVIDMSDGRDFGVQFALWHATNEPRVDFVTIDVSNNDGNTWITMETREGNSSQPEWVLLEYLVGDFVQQTDRMRFRVGIVDQPNNSVTEGGLDAFKVRVSDCPSHRDGDLNCDGVIDAFDIEPFILALTDPPGYAARFPDCDRNLADINGDDEVNAFDIEPFIGLLLP